MKGQGQERWAEVVMRVKLHWLTSHSPALQPCLVGGPSTDYTANGKMLLSHLTWVGLPVSVARSKNLRSCLFPSKVIFPLPIKIIIIMQLMLSLSYTSQEFRVPYLRFKWTDEKDIKTTKTQLKLLQCLKVIKFQEVLSHLQIHKTGSMSHPWNYFTAAPISRCSKQSYS